MVETGIETAGPGIRTPIVIAAGEDTTAGGSRRRRPRRPRGKRPDESATPPDESDRQVRTQPDRATLERLRARLKRRFH